VVLIYVGERAPLLQRLKYNVGRCPTTKKIENENKKIKTMGEKGYSPSNSRRSYL
jgi:hypothetical protein